MKKINNMFDLKKKESKRNKRRVKEVTKFKDKEINELRMKSVLGIGSGIFLVMMGALIKKLGIQISNEEMNAIANNPTVINYLMSVFSYAFYGIGGAITAYNSKEAYERSKKIKDLKVERDKIKDLYKEKTISKEEKEVLKSYKISKN